MYQGDYPAASTVVFNFNTVSFADGSPITLAGTPALSIYKNSITESTAGVSLTVDYDSHTGMHHVVINTSADGTFYAAGNDFDVIITAGTVGGTSVVGRKVGSFSLENRTQKANVTKWNGTTVVTPDTAGVPIVDNRTTTIRVGTSQSDGTHFDNIVLDAAASGTDNIYRHAAVHIISGTGAGQSGRIITAYNGLTKTATISPIWDIPADGTSVFSLTAAGSDMQAIAGNAVRIGASGYLLTDIGSINGVTGGAKNLYTLVQDYAGSELLASLVGDVQGKVLAIVDSGTPFNGVGVWVRNETGQKISNAADNADTLLARNIKGGSSTGRIVSEALAASRNKVAFDVPVVGQFTVYDIDDISPLWVGTYSRGANTLGPLTGVDPN